MQPWVFCFGLLELAACFIISRLEIQLNLKHILKFLNTCNIFLRDGHYWFSENTQVYFLTQLKAFLLLGRMGYFHPFSFCGQWKWVKNTFIDLLMYPLVPKISHSLFNGNKHTFKVKHTKGGEGKYIGMGLRENMLLSRGHGHVYICT